MYGPLVWHGVERLLEVDEGYVDRVPVVESSGPALERLQQVGPSIERAIDEQVITAYGFDGEVTNVIDNLQLEHACCGGSNYEVYEDSRWASHPSDIVPKFGLVPDSCCVRNASTLEILDPKACHGDTLTLPNSVNSNGCAPILAVDGRYNLVVFASCSIALCVWMMYSVVQFVSDESVAVVAKSWFFRDQHVAWPKEREMKRLLEANERPSDGAKIYEDKVLRDGLNLEKARRLAKKAEDTDNLSSSEPTALGRGLWINCPSGRRTPAVTLSPKQDRTVTLHRKR
ncbi:hypothetical protein SprV_0100089600 [Sparganum proliferum]